MKQLIFFILFIYNFLVSFLPTTRGGRNYICNQYFSFASFIIPRFLPHTIRCGLLFHLFFYLLSKPQRRIACYSNTEHRRSRFSLFQFFTLSDWVKMSIQRTIPLLMLIHVPAIPRHEKRKSAKTTNMQKPHKHRFFLWLALLYPFYQQLKALHVSR